MFNLETQLLSLFELTIFISVVLMHLVRRNSHLVMVYALQSFAVSGMLMLFGIKDGSSSLIIVALVTFIIKVVVGPVFFTKLINRKKLNITADTYLNFPLTLATVLGLTILAKSDIFTPVISLFPQDPRFVAFSIAGILISMFLIINRRGVFSQLTGILSFENNMVALAVLAGIEQTLAIEIGILVNILIWIVISGVLVTLVYTHFGSLDTKEMNRLKG